MQIHSHRTRSADSKCGAVSRLLYIGSKPRLHLDFNSRRILQTIQGCGPPIYDVLPSRSPLLPSVRIRLRRVSISTYITFNSSSKQRYWGLAMAVFGSVAMIVIFGVSIYNQMTTIDSLINRK